MLVTPSEIVTFFIFGQSLKAFPQIRFILSGIVTSVTLDCSLYLYSISFIIINPSISLKFSRYFVPQKALLPIKDTLSGIFILSNDGQFLKALILMEITPSGISTLVSSVQSINAP